MNFRLILASLLLLVGPLVAQPATIVAATPAQESAADADYEALWKHFNERAPENLNQEDRVKRADAKYLRFSELARAFAASYPQDPRRYDGMVQSSFTRPQFITGFKPGYATQPGEKNLLVNESSVITWLEEQRGYLTAVITAPDASARHRGGAAHAFLTELRLLNRMKGESADLAPLREMVDRVLTIMPDERALPLVSIYLTALRLESPAKAEAFETRIQSLPTLSTALAAAAEEKRQAARQAALKVADLRSLKFIAADGREVDVSRLKGKVVLIDFWATWCGPCVAELPNVRKVYEDYHDKGFEVVGVTLERGAGPQDTPEEAATKTEASRNKMLAFTAKNEMPWPQHFDGRYFQNEFAVKFGINSIPAMFLLDQEGKVVATEARGEKLEAEVKRLLAL